MECEASRNRRAITGATLGNGGLHCDELAIPLMFAENLADPSDRSLNIFDAPSPPCMQNSFPGHTSHLAPSARTYGSPINTSNHKSKREYFPLLMSVG